MKKQHLLVFFASILLNVSTLFAQQKQCAVVEHEQYLLNKYPQLQAIRQNGEIAASQMQQRLGALKLTSTTNITIPVVVHVVYNVDSQNVSDAQILSQIEALNRDYNKLNADTSQIPAPFKSLAANTGFEFCLAQFDPSGKDTNGITRKHTTAASFGIDDAVKDTAKGWDPTRYLNIWVCNLGLEYYGYGQFPYNLAVSPNTDGVVVNFYAFGQNGTAQAPSNLGRTCVHEVGHWLNLIHTWGDAYCGNDSVADTPPQTQPHYNCNVTFPDLTTACNTSTEPYGTMFMDYMDYSDDPCLWMFTNDQSARMLSAFYTYRSSILNANVCTPNLSMGIIPLSQPHQPAVYPNPASGSLTISASEPIKQIQLFNVLGQLVFQDNFENIQSSIQSINTYNQKNGVYMLRVNTFSATTATKVIIQH